MKVQKKISIQGEWAKIKLDIKDGDVIKIADEGRLIPGEFGERHVFKVETNNGEKLLTFNQTSMNNLISAYGEETNEWQGENIKVWIVKMNVGGKMKDIVFLAHPDWVMGEDGLEPADGERGIPIVEE